MEGLIFVIIAAIIGIVSNAKKGESSTSKTKPFANKPLSKNTVSDLEDYVKDFYEDTFGESKSQVNKPSPVKEKKVQPSEVGRKERSQEARTERRGRLSLHQESETKSPTVKPKNSIIPSTKEEIIQGIIFSEILSKPKSKRS
ncbi:hypothetical protein [Paenisporosarcina cavernae]|uniref:Uncharacterized protein n=1 Tax=Paenisporosarcina cavernae TaxID=2320858 RepID=A0A385YVA1_9BACL|nr:hypothetical protein [Paenisporosarcina cavernae]AYC29618.1 hypothetical protein D3873_06855 [Paenisporosarcina cavernae]